MGTTTTIVAQIRAELSRTQMAGCELPLANVIHSVIHCARLLCSSLNLQRLALFLNIHTYILAVLNIQ